MLSTTLRRRSVGTRIAVTLGALAIGMSTAACSRSGQTKPRSGTTVPWSEHRLGRDDDHKSGSHENRVPRHQLAGLGTPRQTGQRSSHCAP
ncbi:hypothetical protein GS886_27485 [Rhodococcus hoagii]|nr:hypothetical protein [Prescottella equi]